MSDALTSSSRSRPDPRPDANFGYLFRLAHQRFRALLDSELADLGLSAAEYGILSVFETRPELSIAELARITQVTRQTMHTSVLALEAAGLVERTARNRRVVLLRLTTPGYGCLAAATHRVREVERAAIADLGPQDQRTVRTWLATVAAMSATPRQAGVSAEERR
jgi:DNA-binding MarR family transcriptional regulator